MLVSGGKVLAIDRIKTNSATLSGDGVWTELGLNTSAVIDPIKNDISSLQVVTDVMLTSATNSTTSFVSSGIADLTPLYTYIKSLEDRIAALEAGTATTPIVNGYNPTVNGDIPII